jgi:PAS domain S-box-containing protein
MDGRISVLYIDDEPELLDIARIFLEKTGDFRVTTTTSAKIALDSSLIPSNDLIIADYQMPEMDGIALLKEVRSRFGNIPFILFTGRGREEVVIEAINNGADFYLQKGGDPRSQFAELAHKIRQAVSRKRAEYSLIESEKRLTDIINFLPDATFAIDTAGTVIAWNHAIEEMTGIPGRAILGKGDYEYAIPFYGTRRKILIDRIFEPGDDIAEEYIRIFREKDVLIAEMNLPRPLGNVLTIMSKAGPLYNREGKVVGAIETIRDITQREQDAEQIAHKTKALSFINQIIQATNRQQTIEEYARSVLSLTIDLLHYDAGGVYLVDPDQKTARIVCKKNIDPEFIREVDNLDIRSPPFDALFIRGEPVFLNNFETTLPRAAEISGFHAVASIPIVSQDNVIGALNIASRQRTPVGPEDSRILIAIGRELGSAITRIKAELALQEREKLLLLFIRHAPAALAMLDRNLRYIAASSRWMADYHLGDQDLVGRSHLEIFPELSNGIKDVLRRGLAGEITSGDDDRFERQDGSVQWLAWEVRPWYTAGNDIGGVIIFSEDITKRKNSEEALRKSEEKYRRIIENLQDAYIQADANEIILMASPSAARMYGYGSAEEMIGISARTLYGRRDQHEEVQRIIQNGKKITGYTCEALRKDGTTFPISLNVQSILNEEGKVLGYEGIVRDLSQMRPGMGTRLEEG